MSINDQPVNVLIDSGAYDNVLDKQTFCRLFRHQKLRESKVRLFAYGADTPLKVLGELTADLAVNDRRCRADFKVVNGSAGCFLSHHTSRELALFQTESFAALNVPNVANLAGDQRYQRLMDRFPEVFNERVDSSRTFKYGFTSTNWCRPNRCHPDALATTSWKPWTERSRRCLLTASSCLSRGLPPGSQLWCRNQRKISQVKCALRPTRDAPTW